MKGSMRVAAVLCVSVLLAGCGIERKIDRTIDQIDRGVGSFEDLVMLLEDLKQDLDRGDYARQVDGMISNARNVAQVGGEAYFDFVRSRVREDLVSLGHQVRGLPPPPRVPVLTSPSLSMVDFDDQTLAVLSVVGWNLDVAARDPARYGVSVHTREQCTADTTLSRPVASNFVTYQGQYQVSVDVSRGTGVPFTAGDYKVQFDGYDPPFAIPILNARSQAKTVSLSLNAIHVIQDCDRGTDGGDFTGEVRMRLPDGSEKVLTDLNVIDGPRVREGGRATLSEAKASFIISPGQSARLYATGMRETTGNDHEFDDNPPRDRLDETLAYDALAPTPGANFSKRLDDGDECMVEFEWSLQVDQPLC